MEMSASGQLGKALVDLNTKAVALVESCAPPPDSIPRDVLEAMADEIGRSTVAYVEVMYPEAIKATSSTFKLSLRNHIYNDIMAATKLHTETEMRASVNDKAAFRKQWLAMWRKLRR